MSLATVVTTVVVATIGCTTYSPPGAPIDATVDASACTAAGTSCADPLTLRSCSAIGDAPSDTRCSWGCLEGPARCGALVPGGGAVMATDLDPSGLSDIDLQGAVDGTSGALVSPSRPPGTGIDQGIDFLVRNNVGVFRFKSLHVTGNLLIGGDLAVALVADGPIVVSANIDARGPCTGTLHGPGGFSGGALGNSGDGAGGGDGASFSLLGGGGGGAGGVGGKADTVGAMAPGGEAFGDSTISMLLGGGGGGSGAGTLGGVGGGGGGAIQLVSNTSITINGGINAGGCGGKAAGNGNNDAGGGGGAGGTILLEAPTITVNAMLAVNGGSGGNRGTSGTSGGPSRAPSTTAGTGGAGDGAAGALPDGGVGTSAGGGGGAIGRIRFELRAGEALTLAALLSPALDDVPTTATQGDATVE